MTASVKQKAARLNIYKTLLTPFSLIWKYRRIIKGSVASELKSTYAGSVFGVAWVAIGPLILFCLYAAVYGVIFRVRPAGMMHGQYIIYVLAGLTAFTGFSSSLTAGAQSLTSSKQLLLSTSYPAELLGFRTVLVQSAQILAGLFLTIIFSFFIVTPNPWLLLLPFVVVAQVLFTCALVWVLSLASLGLRDIQYFLQYAMFILLIVTPIGYDRNLVPASIQWISYLNPLYYFVTLYQDIIVFGSAPPLLLLFVCLIGSILAFVGAFYVFKRLKQVFFDYA